VRIRALPLIGVSALAATPLLTAAAGAPAAAAAAVPAQVRVNQVASPPDGAKVAYAMLPARVSGVSFTVSGAHGAVLRGRSTADAGSWNSRYHAVYKLQFSAVRRPGQYCITVTAGGQSATSPPFAIGATGAQYGRLVTNAVRYFTSERDGIDVERPVLNREPANLTDTSAAVYAAPKYDSNDNLVGKLSRIGGPANVAGGWFDAGGGYEKFAYTASYADGLLQIAQRDFPGRYPTLGPEARFGLSWLQKLWNPAKKTLYIRSGSATATRATRSRATTTSGSCRRPRTG